MGRINPGVLKRVLAIEGARLEISDPFPIHATGRYMCLAKVVGKKYELPKIPTIPSTVPPTAIGKTEDPEPTQTLCVLSEEANTPEEARQRLLERIEAVHALPEARPGRPRRGWLGRLIAAFKT